MPDFASCLVTGGTGVLGRALVRRLVAAGVAVRVISRQPEAVGHTATERFQGDITRSADLRAAMHGCEAVYHCAAEKSDGSRMRAVNVDATRELFAVAAAAKIKFICHLSSVGVIGRVHARLVDETTPCRPVDLYERTKLEAEQIAVRGLAGGRVIILRPTNIFDSRTVQTLLEDSLSSRMRMFVKGAESSHLVYVEDVAAAVLHCSEAAGTQHTETFIVSSDEEGCNTHQQVRQAVAVLNQVPSRSWIPPLPQIIPHYMRLLRKGASNRGDVVYSSAKLRNMGFCFPYGLQRGLRAAVEELRTAGKGALRSA